MATLEYSEAQGFRRHVKHDRHGIRSSRQPEVFVFSFSEESRRAEPERCAAHHVQDIIVATDVEIDRESSELLIVINEEVTLDHTG